MSAAEIYANAQATRHSQIMRRLQAIRAYDAKFIAQLKTISQKFDFLLNSRGKR